MLRCGGRLVCVGRVQDEEIYRRDLCEDCGVPFTEGMVDDDDREEDSDRFHLLLTTVMAGDQPMTVCPMIPDRQEWNRLTAEVTAKLKAQGFEESPMASRRARRAVQGQQETCYMCDRVATTREHAPPRSFFPRDRRVNVIKVPSCTTHNNDNHLDVEYARNLIASDIHVNAIGLAMFETARRSFER